MKLIIEIDVDSSDLEDRDVETFLKEARRDGASIAVQVGSSLSEEESEISRMFAIGTEYFEVHTQE